MNEMEALHFLERQTATFGRRAESEEERRVWQSVSEWLRRSGAEFAARAPSERDGSDSLAPGEPPPPEEEP